MTPSNKKGIPCTSLFSYCSLRLAFPSSPPSRGVAQWRRMQHSLSNKALDRVAIQRKVTGQHIYISPTHFIVCFIFASSGISTTRARKRISFNINYFIIITFIMYYNLLYASNINIIPKNTFNTLNNVPQFYCFIFILCSQLFSLSPLLYCYLYSLTCS